MDSDPGLTATSSASEQIDMAEIPPNSSDAESSFVNGNVPRSPTKRRKRKMFHYLRIIISPPVRGALPGYEGDRRVEWAVSGDANSLVEAAEKTREALLLLVWGFRAHFDASC